MPGFPQMAWPMVDWVLATHYPDLRAEPRVERAIVVYDGGESHLLPLMNENVERFPNVKLFSLPTFMTGGRRRLELGVRGTRANVEPAYDHLVAGVAAAGYPYEPMPQRGGDA